MALAGYKKITIYSGVVFLMLAAYFGAGWAVQMAMGNPNGMDIFFPS